jgi:hypothetical protein
MQTYAQVPTRPNVIRTAERFAETTFYRIGEQTIETFRNSALFVLALQTNDLIRTIINANYFAWSQFYVILLFVLIVILISYTKEIFADKFSAKNKPITDILKDPL